MNGATLLSRCTGGRIWSFLKQRGLEEGSTPWRHEAHEQYIVSFQPKREESGVFHTLRAEVRGRPELKVRTRTGCSSVR